MSFNSLIMSDFQAQNPERFNKEMIYMRKQEDIGAYLRDLFNSLKIPGIKFLDYEVIHDETRHKEYVPKTHKIIEESRLDLISARFELSATDEDGQPVSKVVTLNQFFPKLIDDFFFELAGNRYFALYQISDRNFYSTSKALYLKTLLMPLGVRYQPAVLEATNGQTFASCEYKLDFFRSKSGATVELKNMFLYYFIEYGVEDTLDFVFNNNHSLYEACGLGGEEELPSFVFLEEAECEEYEGYLSYQIKKGFYLYFLDPELCNNNSNYIALVTTLAMSLKGTRKVASLMSDPNYLKKRILNSPTANINKADKAIVSLKRVLDERTKTNLELPSEHTSDSFAVIRYMTTNYAHLVNLDTVDLRNRRLRLYEYMLYPLLVKFSDASYRILNSRSVNIKRLETVFSNIRPGYIVKNLVNNELLRYYNATSTLELFSVALRYSARGPQALGGGGNGIVLKYRSVHHSYVGTVGLNMASASDPGMTGTLCPLTNRIKDMKFL